VDGTEGLLGGGEKGNLLCEAEMREEIIYTYLYEGPS